MPGDSVIAGGEIRHLHELRLVQAAVPKEEWGNIKLTMITAAGRAYTPEAYEDDAKYSKDVAKAYQKELEVLYGAGLRNVQFDDPGLAYFCSMEFRNGWDQDLDNIGTADDLLDTYIDLYNYSVSMCKPGMHTGVHLCRGNFIGGRRFAEGAYDIIAQKLFENLNVSAFYPEHDTERAEGFEPLSTKVREELEDKEDMKKRINKAADFVAQGSKQTREETLKRIGISPQCGSSTHESGLSIV